MTRATRTRLNLAAAPVTAYVVAMVLIAALWTKPPLLGWIGLGLVALVGLGWIAAAFVLFPRSRENASPVTDADRASGILVLADATCSAEQLSAAVARHVASRDANVYVVAPLLPSTPADYFNSDETSARQAAQWRLDKTLQDLRRAGIPATGSLGTDDPIQAVGDALAVFPASELVVVTSEDSGWLEDGLVERARELVPSVDEIVVPSSMTTRTGQLGSPGASG